MEPRKPRPLGRGFFTFYILLTTFYLNFSYPLPPPASAMLKALRAGNIQIPNSNIQITNKSQVPNHKLN